MHLAPQITDLALILSVAAAVTFLFHKIKQPLVLGYLVAGVIVGPYVPSGLDVHDISNIQVWAELGVIFLMFSLGLEFTFHKLVRVGASAAGTAWVEVVLMVTVGYLAGKFIGWSDIDSLFLGGILSISSTTIILKAFGELGLRTRRFSEIVIGVLIVEDLVAILLLVALSTASFTKSLLSVELVFAAGKLLAIVGSWFLVGYVLIPRTLRYAGRFLQNESLTILSTALCLGLVVIATHFSYSAALGAFIMGSILAETSEGHRIEHLIQPLRDLFAAVFFVSVGMMVDPKTLVNYAGPIALISFLTIVGKIFSSSVGAFLTGQPVKRSVRIGFSLAQIGEFSFIIATLGTTLKVTSDFLYPIAVAVSVITTFTTPYLIRVSLPVAEWLEKALPPWLTARLEAYTAWVQSPRAGLKLGTKIAKGVERLVRDPQLATLAPWDVHAVRLIVHQNSSFAGKKIIEAAIRSRFGVNIVAIQRGPKCLASPSAKEILLPHDELLVLGTDPQIEAFQAEVEAPSTDIGDGTDLSEYFLRRVYVDDASPLAGQSIQASGLRESLNGLIVGLERATLRTLNPDPSLILAPGDLLWVVTGPNS